MVTTVPRVYLSSLRFSDGSEVAIEPEDTVLIVGPNNSGKSAALHDILRLFSNPREKTQAVVVKDLTLRQVGTGDDFVNWLPKRHLFGVDGPAAPVGSERQRATWRHAWDKGDLSGSAGNFICHLSTGDRLSLANPPGEINFLQSVPKHPIHWMVREDSVEERICGYFRQAFGTDLVVNKAAGYGWGLHCGLRPTFHPGEHAGSSTYVERIRALPELQHQGDGMKSFAGVLLGLFALDTSICLIDEPEAFLHPPQARLLGRLLAAKRPTGRQVVLATHSGEVLRGALDADSAVRVLRLRRSHEVNIVSELQPSEVRQLWSNPILRYSNVLDGLFHERVVICEGDADCRLYSAIAQALHPTESADVLFCHGSGKDRAPTLAESLVRLGVPTRVVLDFDALRDATLLSRLVKIFGGQWHDLEPLHNKLCAGLSSEKLCLSRERAAKEIDEVLTSGSHPFLASEELSRLSGVLRRSSAWGQLKETGLQGIPRGDSNQACRGLLDGLESYGIVVLRSGELESVGKQYGGHGPSWLMQLLESESLTDSPDLAPAREVVAKFLS